MSTVVVGRAQRSAQLARPGWASLKIGHSPHPKHLLNALQYSVALQWSWVEQPFSTVVARVVAASVPVTGASEVAGTSATVVGRAQRSAQLARPG